MGDDVLLLTLLSKHVDEGNRSLMAFKHWVWPAVRKEFNDASPGIDLTQDQINSRYQNLRKIFQWGEEIATKSGGRFDPVTWWYNGPEQWLIDYCMANNNRRKLAKYFQKFPYLLRPLLRKVFLDDRDVPGRGDNALAVEDLEQQAAALPKKMGKGGKNGKHPTVVLSMSVEQMADAMKYAVDADGDWVSKATEEFAAKKYQTRIPEAERQNGEVQTVLKRFREEEHLAQQFFEARSTTVRSMVLGLDLGPQSPPKPLSKKAKKAADSFVTVDDDEEGRPRGVDGSREGEGDSDGMDENDRLFGPRSDDGGDSD